MGTIAEAFATAFREFTTDGVPSSGAHHVVKADAKALGALIENALGVASLGGVDAAYATRALLNADLNHAAGSTGLVYADAIDANNDLYVKTGGVGAGAWTLTTVLHDAFEGLAAPFVAAAEAAAADADAAVSSVRSVAARAYGLVPTAYGQAVWDLSLWQTQLFKNAAGTDPVTQPGDRVGCVRNVLGESSWDYVQADNAKRPTFQIVDGRPRIDIAPGEGMASRAVHDIPVPFHFVAAMQRQNDAAAFSAGIFSRGVAAHAFLAHGGQRMAAYHEAEGSLLYTATPFYSAPDGTEFVLDTVVRNNQADIRLNGGGMEAPYSPVAVNTDGGDIWPTAILALNGSAQSLAGQAAANYNALHAFSWFGGAISFGDPDAEGGDRDTIVGYFRGQIEPEIRATDHVIFINGDSTGDDVSNITAEWESEVFHKWAKEAGHLPALFPTSNIYYRNYAFRGQQFTGYQRVQAGAGGPRVFVINASVSGSQPGYHLAGRFPESYGWLPKIDRHIWNHGHNLPVAVDQVTHDAELLRLGEWLDAMDQVRAAFPRALHFSLRTHPNMAVGNETILPVVESLDEAMALYGDMGFADVYAHFDGAGRPAAWHTGDNVHLSPAGVAEQLSVFSPAYATWAPLAVPAAPLIGRTTTSILANPRFDEFDGAVPLNWVLVGPAACRRSADAVDPLSGNAYSVRLTKAAASAASYLSATFDATPYQGQTLVLAVRQLMRPGGGGLMGRIQVGSNGTNPVSPGSWVYDPSLRPVDGWRTRYLHLPLPADATQGEVRLYASPDNTAADVFYSEALLFPGLKPRLLR